MAEKGNQHYVAQFYLRHFSIHQNKKQIGIYNLASDTFIPEGKLKSQASNPYYYGKDGVIENMLAKVESDLAPLIARICSEKSPIITDLDKAALFFFTFLSEMCTPSTINKMANFEENLIQAISSMPGDSSEFQKRKTHEERIQETLEAVKRAVVIACDLHLCVLKFFRETPFITSDNPVAKYNQFWEVKKGRGDGTGHASKGLQMFVPLNPQTALFFYDPWAYNVSNIKDGIITINDLDVRQLNILQLINCHKNVFFNHAMDYWKLKLWHDQSKNYVRPNTPLQQVFKISNERRFITVTTTSCQAKLALSFVSPTLAAQNFQLGNRMVYLRDQALIMRQRLREGSVFKKKAV